MIVYGRNPVREALRGRRRVRRVYATEKAATVFVTIYGAEAGNLALKGLALGGVVVAGGIAPRILPLLQDGRFISAFRDKGRLAALLDLIPVRVAVNPGAPLLGAARVATALLRV